MKELTFEIPGKPAAWARPRSNGRRHFNSAKHKAGLQNTAMAFQAAHPDWQPWDGPVVIRVTAFFQPPQKFWGQQCTKRPDLDNLLKLVGDGLNGLAYRDDSQIISATVIKHFTMLQERTYIVLEFHEPTPKPKKGTSKNAA